MNKPKLILFLLLILPLFLFSQQKTSKLKNGTSSQVGVSATKLAQLDQHIENLSLIEKNKNSDKLEHSVSLAI